MASEVKKYAIGGFAVFAAYGTDLTSDPSFVPVLTSGQRVKIEKINDDEGMVVLAVDETGAILKDADGKAIGDTVFPEEVEAEAEVEGDEEVVTETVAAEAPKAGKRAAGNGKAKPAAAEKVKAPTKAEQKAADKAAAEKAKADALAKKEADKAAALKAKEDAKAAKDAEKQKKAEAKLATPDNDDPLMIRVEETQSVTAAIAQEKSALAAAKMLVNRSEQTDFTLGGVLHNIYITGAFKTLGYDGKRGFSDYVEKELGVQYRKARYLISIYTTFAQVFRAKGITEEDLLKLGWSKAKELARIPVNKLVEDYDSLMSMASDGTKSRDELIAHINKNYEVITRNETVQAVSLKFRLIADAADTVNQALEKAKGLAGDGADLNKALEYMAGDWLNTAASETTMTLQSLIDLAQAQFGVTLVTADEAATGVQSDDEHVAEQAA